MYYMYMIHWKTEIVLDNLQNKKAYTGLHFLLFEWLTV